jgi:GNAT superfamily N-acetyltransferase
VTDSYRIETLSEETVQTRLDEILEFERMLYSQLGTRYSHVVWGRNEFLLLLPGKWELSKVAVDDHGALIGLWIASHDGVEDLRGHRGGVRREWRHTGIWRALFEQIYADGKNLGLKYMSHTVNADNPGAVAAWQALGFRILEGEELEAFRLRRGRDDDRIEDSRLVSPDGHAYCALKLEIR